jgi:hypothetical protein
MSQNNHSPTAPPTFKAKDRTWTINLTLGLIDHVQEAAGVDLLADDTAPVLSLLFDRRKLGGVLWACVDKAAGALGITRDDFLDSLDGDALTAGWGALVDAIVFFTPIQSRKAVEAAFNTQMEAMEQGVTALVEVAASQETNQAIREAVIKLKEEMQADLPRQLAASASS